MEARRITEIGESRARGKTAPPGSPAALHELSRAKKAGTDRWRRSRIANYFGVHDSKRIEYALLLHDKLSLQMVERTIHGLRNDGLLSRYTLGFCF